MAMAWQKGIARQADATHNVYLFSGRGKLLNRGLARHVFAEKQKVVVQGPLL